MPDRYWVGGTANWDGTAGTKWSATSGGPGGASVPTSVDDVFFDAASGVGTVTIASGNTGARSINCTGFTGTITGTAAISIAGSITLVTAMTWSHTGDVTITGSGTLTTAGKNFSRTIINGAGITVGLGDALTVRTGTTSASLDILQGTFNTNNFNVTLQSTNNNGGLNVSGTLPRTVNLGSSTISIAAAGAGGSVIFTTPTTNLTFNAGTSTFLISGLITPFIGGGLTYHNVSFTNTGITANATTITDVNTFNNLSFAAPATAGIRQVQLNNRQIINGTLSTTGTAGNRRVWFRSATYGIALPLLTVNGSTILTNADFRDVIVTGTAAPISGTRIGDLRGNGGITFSTPKRVFRIGTGNWSDDQWAATSGGAVSTDNFPLAQDTAVFDQNTAAGTHTMDSAVPYCGTVDMSARTSALTLNLGAQFTVYGSWIYGSGISTSGGNAITFSGRNTQTITSAGKTFPGGVIVDSFGGYVELADALTAPGTNITISNGTFDTRGFSVTSATLLSSGSTVRSIILGSSTVTLSGSTPINFSSRVNLTLDAGTSTIVCSATSVTFEGNGLTFSSVQYTATSNASVTLRGSNTFLNMQIAKAFGIKTVQIADNQIITGTLSDSGSISPTNRIQFESTVPGNIRTLTVNALSLSDCDFQDITIAGAAAGSSITRAGDIGGNSGITFPAPKTVYWNLAGSQNWSAIGWALSSGGSPDINNFPLAHDTAVFDNAGAAGTVSIETPWRIGTLNAGARTTSMTLAFTTSLSISRNCTFGTGITISGSGGLLFIGRGTSTLTSNGVTLAGDLQIEMTLSGTLQLADALTVQSTRFITLRSGTFNAASFNVTTGSFTTPSGTSNILNMGSGTWTLTGIDTVWNMNNGVLVFIPGTANIVLSNNTTSARTFNGGGLSYNRLTIGGATSTSTTTITGNNTFAELASTKTVAHTIAFGASFQTFGAWTVTGTLGNVVTVTGGSANISISGQAVSGIDYLAMGSTGLTSNSPGEFYAGPNSTGTAGAPVYRTAKPADSVRYWVGGTGNWSDTARWALDSGSAGGASVPRSHDDVIFNNLSNPTGYTATIDTTMRCKSLTISPPASGNITLSGAAALIVHNNVTLPTTGLTRTYSGNITLSGSTTGRTFTTNGVTLASNITVDGIGCGWSLGSTLTSGGGTVLGVTNGTFSLANFNLSISALSLVGFGRKTISLGSGTITLTALSPLDLGTTESESNALTFNANTSTININTNGFAVVRTNNKTFNNVVFNSLGGSISGGAVFNNLTITGRGSAGVNSYSMPSSITVNGQFGITAPINNPSFRTYITSGLIGTSSTITCGSFVCTDADFRDITIAGAAAPASGTRLGDCKGNSGITFPAGTTKFWNLAGGGNWSATGWATSSGGTPAIDNFPLAQDTCVFQGTGLNSGASITMNASYNVGTINMSARTTNTMTFNVSNAFTIYGDWINGTGTSIGTTSTVTFSGRGTQTITSAGRPMLALTIDSPGGTVTLQDSYSATGAQLTLTRGTFNLNNFNLTTQTFASSTAATTRGLVFGSGTYTLVSSPFTVTNPSGFTASGSNGTISMASASAKTFNGADIVYSGIAIDQSGPGILTITGNNTFRDIISTHAVAGSSAAAISLATTTQRVTQFRGRGVSGRQLTISGTSSTSPCTLIYTGTGYATNSSVDFLTLTGVRAYVLQNTWFAGNNSINDGTLGWIFAGTPAVVQNGNFLMLI